MSKVWVIAEDRRGQGPVVAVCVSPEVAKKVLKDRHPDIPTEIVGRYPNCVRLEYASAVYWLTEMAVLEA